MRKFKDRSGVPKTCPKIDQVGDFIENTTIDITTPYGDDIERAAESAREMLEEIREANLTLREWGNDKAEELEETEKIVKELEDKITDLEDEISRMRRRIEFLEEGEDQW